MADSNPTPVLSFTAAPVYQLLNEVTQADMHDQLTARVRQLEVMLTVITSAGHDWFANFSIGVREDYLWTCRMMAIECRELVDQLHTAEPDPAEAPTA